MKASWSVEVKRLRGCDHGNLGPRMSSLKVNQVFAALLLHLLGIAHRNDLENPLASVNIAPPICGNPTGVGHANCCISRKRKR